MFAELARWFQTSSSWFGTVAAWFAALATTSAVLVALFAEPYRRWRRRPILRASIATRPPDSAKNVVVVARGIDLLTRVPCYYLRLWIENTGKGRAKQVQVYAAELLKKDDDSNEYRRMESFLPMNLTWAHSKPGAIEVFAQGISPLMGKHCDLAHVVEPVGSETFGVSHEDALLGNCRLILNLEAPPNTGSHLLPAGAYRLKIRVAAANARPALHIVDIWLSGRWYDDQEEMFSKGVTAAVYIVDS